MAAGDRIPIRVTRGINAPPERVFDGWLDPKSAGQWLFKTPTGEMKRVEIDPRVGGGFVIVERRGAQDAEHFGKFLELDRPRRIVFAFSAEKGEQNPDPVTVEIAPRDSGSEVTLTHELNPAWADYTEQTRKGWADILDGLARTVE